MSLSAEISRQMAIKAALVNTTNTPGWQFIKEMADKIIANCVQEALDEENPTTGESKRLKAKALQKGFSDLFSCVDNVKTYNPAAPADSGFESLAFENEIARELQNQ